MRKILSFTLVSFAFAGCDKDDDKDSGSSSSSSSSGDTGSAWIVGGDGEMVRLVAGGESAPYPLDETRDLYAIACKGREQAWVVGAGGALLRTRDGGTTWSDVETGSAASLRAVATAEGSVVWAAGDGGVVLRSADEGTTFAPLPAPSSGLDFTGIATTAAGDLALATSTQGKIVRLDADGTRELFDTAGVPLLGLSVAPDGSFVAAVGSEGLLLRSDDAGRTFERIPLGTVRDLHAVRIGADGQRIVAVGEAGVVVTLAGPETTDVELLGETADLHALHLDRHGHGHAVGSAGIALETTDFGATWTAVPLDVSADLFGVDDLHGEPHL